MAALVLPTAMSPKWMLAGVTVVCIVPVPLRAMLCGLALSGLSVTVSVPLAAPKLPGAKVRDTVQDLKAASVAPQVVADIAKPLPLTPRPTLTAID